MVQNCLKFIFRQRKKVIIGTPHLESDKNHFFLKPSLITYVYICKNNHTIIFHISFILIVNGGKYILLQLIHVCNDGYKSFHSLLQTIEMSRQTIDRKSIVKFLSLTNLQIRNEKPPLPNWLLQPFNFQWFISGNEMP